MVRRLLLVALQLLSARGFAPPRAARPAPRARRPAGAGADQEPLLRADALRKSHDGVRAQLAGVSLALRAGETVALVGANGCGKSTLLRLLAGLDAPDDGGVAPRRGAEVRLVDQEPTFDADLSPTARAAVDLACAGAGTPGWRRAEALARLGLGAGAQAVRTLSGGERKRLALACALAARPDVLLLDEPTNHLDAAGVRWLEARLGRDAGGASRAQGATVVVT